LSSTRCAGKTDPIDYDAESFKLVFGPNTQMYLHNAYGDYIKAPRQLRAEVLKRYATAWTGTGGEAPPLEEALPNLYP
jgi:hypothetical protein